MPVRPVRVLHVVGKMDRAGLETWLMHILRRIDRRRFRIDFVVHSATPGAYDDEIRALGSRIYPCPAFLNPWAYARAFNRILLKHGPYDVVHSHVHHFSGYVLKLAHRAGIKARIAHSHVATSALEPAAPLLKRGYLALSRHLINAHATAGFACNNAAAPCLFGAQWNADPRWRVLYYGVDLQPFESPVEPGEVRRSLGLPENALVFGHVGRFARQKNHDFLIEVAATILRKEPRAHLLMTGEGELRAEVEAKVAAYALRQRTTFAGSRPDVPAVMKGGIDVFVFPSLYEGSPLVLIEAQAAGLGCVISRTITPEADIVPGRVRRLSLQRPVEEWAVSCLEMAARSRDPEALSRVKESHFNIDAGLNVLCSTYESAGRARGLLGELQPFPATDSEHRSAKKALRLS